MPDLLHHPKDLPLKKYIIKQSKLSIHLSFRCYLSISDISINDILKWIKSGDIKQTAKGEFTEAIASKSC